ncbi:MAG: hypothetical protein ACR2MA_01655 [Egibacteraceae bacterium]
MYTSPEDARSDLFLAGAVYLLGPLVIALVLRLLLLDRIDALVRILALVLPLAQTVLVPYLLIRYRNESLSDYGLKAASTPALTMGAGLALPIVLASLLAALFAGVDVFAVVPLIAVGPGALFDLLVRLVTWLGLTGFAVYVTVKARDAFRADYRTVRDGVIEIGRIVGGLAVVTTFILLVALDFNAARVLLPAGLAASVWLLLRGLKGPTTTSRATLLTPTVLLALGPFVLSLQADEFVLSLWGASLAAGVGLLFGALTETRPSAMGPLGFALTAALISIFPLSAGGL